MCTSTLVSSATPLRFRPDCDLFIAFSVDEETGIVTTTALAERLKGAHFAINSAAGGGYRRSNRGATFATRLPKNAYGTFEFSVRNPAAIRRKCAPTMLRGGIAERPLVLRAPIGCNRPEACNGK